MKIFRLLATALLAVTLSYAQNPSSPTAIAGRFNVSQYSNWSVQATNSVGTGGQTMFVNPCFPKFGTNVQQLFPFATNSPVIISDGSNSETVTPTSVTTNDGTGRCFFFATFTRAHSAGVAVSSGSFGLEEAINDAHNHGGGIATIDSSWPGTTAMITVTGLGFSNVSIEDNRTGNTLYSWNGSHYVISGGGGAGTSVILAPSADQTITGLNRLIVNHGSTSTPQASVEFMGSGSGTIATFPSLVDIITEDNTPWALTIRNKAVPGTIGAFFIDPSGNFVIQNSDTSNVVAGGMGFKSNGDVFLDATDNSHNILLTGHLKWQNDNTADIGASGGNRPRTGYFGTSIVTPAIQLTGATASLPVCTDGSKNLTTTGCPGGPGTAQTSGNIAVSGWGAGAAVSAVTGLGTRSTFTITAGTTPSVNPTIIVTYPVAQPATPVCMPRQDGGGTGITADMAIGTPSTTTSGTITWLQTPVNTSTYIFTVDCRL